jgi:hypothetical protein
LNGSGNISISGKSVVESGNSAAASQTISFADANNDLLKIDNPAAFGASIANWMIGDVADLVKTAVKSVSLSGNTLSVVTMTGQTLSYQVSGALAGNHFAALSDSAGGTDLVLLAGASQWGSFDLPAQPTTGVHIFNNQTTPDVALNQIAIAYSSGTNYDPVNHPSGPYTVTRSVLPLDPFFLQTNVGSQTINTSSLTLPSRASFLMVPINTTNGVQGEGIDFFETQNSNGQNIINRAILTGISGSAPLNVTTTTALENAGTDTIYNINGSTRRDNTGTSPTTLSTYSLAWDRYTASSSNFSLRFQIFNANDTASSSVIKPVITPSGANSVTVATTAMPAWEFHADSGAYVLGIAEANSATDASLNLTGAHQALQFQGYSFSGATNTAKFTIQPDLAGYAAGATNQIIQAKTGSAVYPQSNQLAFFQLSTANSSAYVIAWNELVTDSSGTHDQVEFVVFRTGSGAGTGVVYRQTFQVATGTCRTFARPASFCRETLFCCTGSRFSRGNGGWF